MSRRNLYLTFTLATLSVASPAFAQKHSGGASPPTPPPKVAATPPAPVVPVSSGMGALQFSAAEYVVPSPAALTRLLQSSDDRTRASALSAIGAPGLYLIHGHIPFPHSVKVDVADLGGSSDLDTILTAEFDQHMVSAIMISDEGNWRRLGTVIFPTSYNDLNTNPATFVRIVRSTTQRTHYRVVYHALVSTPDGDYTENEAHLRIVNNNAVVTISFVSASRACDNKSHTGCDVTQRWLQPDPTSTTHTVLMVTGTGHIGPHESPDSLDRARVFETAHLRSFTCQPYEFTDATGHYTPTAAPGPCPSSAKP